MYEYEYVLYSESNGMVELVVCFCFVEMIN